MKPNVQLNHIIALGMDLGCLVDINCHKKEVTVYHRGESKTSQLSDRDGMNKLADWLSLSPGFAVSQPWIEDIAEAKAEAVKVVGIIAAAKAESVKAIKRAIDAPRWTNRNLLDTTAPGVLSS